MATHLEARRPSRLKERPSGQEQYTATVGGRRARPRIAWWAAIGAAFLSLEAFVIAKWIISGQATPTHTGVDAVPSGVKLTCIAVQLGSLALMVVAIIYVVRQCRRQHTLTFDAVLVIAWVLVWWQDPILNYSRTQFFYNSYLVNLGSWTSSIPGWNSPNGHKLPEPLFSGSVYAWMVFTSMLTCVAMRAAKRRWASMGTPTLILVAWGTMFVFDFIVEDIFVRTGLYKFAAVINWLSVGGSGKDHFPLYESFLWGGVWAAVGVLRYFMDDKGRSVVERGVDDMKISNGRKNVLRILAVAGFINVMFLFGYNIPIQWVGQHVDKMPSYPSYLRNDLCGPGTPWQCADPKQPIPLRGQTGPNIPNS